MFLTEVPPVNVPVILPPLKVPNRNTPTGFLCYPQSFSLILPVIFLITPTSFPCYPHRISLIPPLEFPADFSKRLL